MPAVRRKARGYPARRTRPRAGSNGGPLGLARGVAGRALGGYGVGGRFLIGKGPRSRTTNELSHKHVVTILSSSTNYIQVGNDAAGSPSFACPGGGSSPNLSMAFSLDGVQIYLGGAGGFACALPGKLTLTAMYDEYQIDHIEITMFVNNLASNDQVGVSPGLNNVQPIFIAAPDTDDAGSTNRDDLLQYSTVQTFQPTPGKPMVCRIKPAAAVQMYATLVNSGYGRKFSPSLNCSYTNVQHYGFKMCCDGFRAPNNLINCAVDFQFKYFMTFKSTR